jgi:hypothetical protein
VRVTVAQATRQDPKKNLLGPERLSFVGPGYELLSALECGIGVDAHGAEDNREERNAASDTCAT